MSGRAKAAAVLIVIVVGVACGTVGHFTSREETQRCEPPADDAIVSKSDGPVIGRHVDGELVEGPVWVMLQAEVPHLGTVQWVKVIECGDGTYTIEYETCDGEVGKTSLEAVDPEGRLTIEVVSDPTPSGPC